ncbi:uncharacterized protein LY89DRAFT_659889 [Mollisia scopiformis]|uniref:Uncharacterized protein n=1 Tax=Mollisia scopiformis TaxID=149040 RepID=A0A132B5I9_MOLSC|nr:uncharacterized protein LY89DRAFT_659889 [Mollisia scopiformis]KUJ07670.1 hypothetical protein LY89DRAFT_659889 [Mollisia scopiformis]
MGRQGSLTALALGRGHYEDEVIQDAAAENQGAQQYNDRGYPKNPETKRREREHVRAANEVMQVTGVVEDAVAAKEKANLYLAAKNQESFLGLRLMDACRTTFIGGVWGVIGLRRRILLYKPYEEFGLFNILQRERTQYSVAHIAFAGLPATLTHHALEWTSVFIDAVLDALDEDDEPLEKPEERANTLLQTCLDYGFMYLGFHLRMFATLQQLNLIPISRILPSLKSFVPFSSESPLQLPPDPIFSRSWSLKLLWSATPFLVMVGYDRIRKYVAHSTYRPIYKSLPRPTGDVMVQEQDSYPSETYDGSVGATERERTDYDEPTLRALEGLPALERTEPRQEREDSSEDEEDELAHATLISFDVEPTEGAESTAGPWSAELRSANEPKLSDGVKYRVTGLTMLPAIMATEALRDIVTGVLVMPFEAIMVRVLAKAYRESAGLGIGDLCAVGSYISPLGNLVSVVGMQVVVTGIIWTGFTVGTQVWLGRTKLREWRRTRLLKYTSLWSGFWVHGFDFLR